MSNENLSEATQIEPGLMSASDYCKLQKVALPTPTITLTSKDCNATIKSGVIGIVSDDEYVKVDSSVNVKTSKDEFESQYARIPIKIQEDTYGIRLSLDVDRLSNYLLRNGRLRLKGKTGEKGDKGIKGEAGSNYIFSGPKGEDGLPGSTIQTNYSLQNEEIPVTTVGSTGITNIQPVVNSDNTYSLIITRQPIGDPALSTNKIKINGEATDWVAVIDGPGLDKEVFYLDLDPIHQVLIDRANKYADLMKSGYESAVKHWIDTMSDLFDSQKDALCCALNRCKSRIKNDALRRHFELTAATAKPDYKTVIKTRTDNPTLVAGTKVLGELYPDIDLCADPPPPVVPPVDPPPPVVPPVVPPVDPKPPTGVDVYYEPRECAVLDFVLVIDDTGSMGGVINGIKSQITNIIDVVGSISSSSRIGVVSFKDDPTNRLDLTSIKNKDVIVSTVNGLFADGGGDLPEGLAAAVEVAVGMLSSSPKTNAKAIMTITDAPDRQGILAITKIAQKAGSLGIPIFAVSTDSNVEAMYHSKTLAIESKGMYSDNGSREFVGDVLNGLNNWCSLVPTTTTCGEVFNVFGDVTSCPKIAVSLVVDCTDSMQRTITDLKNGFGTFSDYLIKAVGDSNVVINLTSFDSSTFKSLYSGPLSGVPPFIKNLEANLSTTNRTEDNGAYGLMTGIKFLSAEPISTGRFLFYISDAPFDPKEIFNPQVTSAKNSGVRIISINALTDRVSDGVNGGCWNDAESQFKFMSQQTSGIYVRVKPTPDLGSSAINRSMISSIVEMCGPIVPSSLKIAGTRLTVNSLYNIGYPTNAAWIQLPKGRYRITIHDTDALINGSYGAPVSVLGVKGLSTVFYDFVDKGLFDSVLDARDHYNDLSMVIDHDGGKLKAYLRGSYNENNSGDVVLSIVPLSIVLSSNDMIELKNKFSSNEVQIRNIPFSISLDGVDINVDHEFKFENV